MINKKYCPGLILLILSISILTACTITEGSLELVGEKTTITVEAEPPSPTTSSQPIMPPTRETVRRVAGIPTGRSSAAMTYDSNRQIVLMFGGVNPTNGSLDDTWEYDGTQWYQVISTATSPPSRYRHEIAYDPYRQVAVLFGGKGVDESSLVVFDDIGELDSQDWEQIQFVVYGDLWEFDGQNWKQIQFEEMPFPRDSFVMGYYPPEKAIFITAGYNVNESRVTGDAWLYDGQLWPGRTRNEESRNVGLLNQYFNLVNPEMVYDVRRNLLIILYGQVKPTIEFNGVEWEYHESEISVADYPERTRQQGYALSYDQNRGITVLFGGLSAELGDDNFPLNDTWEYDGEVWVEVTPTDSPTARWGHAMVYDEAREVIVLFGGIDMDGNRLNDTWEYDGNTWRQRFFDD